MNQNMMRPVFQFLKFGEFPERFNELEEKQKVNLKCSFQRKSKRFRIDGK